MNSPRNKLIILTILFTGLFLRIYHLSSESIWLDESVSIRLAGSSLFQTIMGSIQDTSPPLYHVLLHFWIKLFGDSEFSTRFLSVIFALFAILMIYKVGTVIFDKEVGILSSLLLGLSTFHISYSQETRMYSLLALLTLLSIYFFIRLFRERTHLVLIGYILSSILLMYTHVYGSFIIVAQNIYIVTLFLLSRRNHQLDLRRWILLQLILIVLFVPGIMVIIYQMLFSGGKTSWIPRPSISTIASSFEIYSGSELLLVLFIILSLFSIVTYKKIWDNTQWKDSFNSIENDLSLSNANRIYLLLLWLLIPIILPFMISQVSKPIYLDRYTIGASVAFYLLVAKGIRDVSNKHVKLFVISIVIILSSVNIFAYYTKVNKKEQWRSVANYVDTNANPSDLVLFNAGYSQIPFDYYSKRTDLSKRRFPEESRDVNEENIKDLGTTIGNYKRVWVIYSHSGDSKGLITKTLSEVYNLSYHNQYVCNTHKGGKYLCLELYMFERK